MWSLQNVTFGPFLPCSSPIKTYNVVSDGWSLLRADGNSNNTPFRGNGRLGCWGGIGSGLARCGATVVEGMQPLMLSVPKNAFVVRVMPTMVLELSRWEHQRQDSQTRDNVFIRAAEFLCYGCPKPAYLLRYVAEDECRRRISYQVYY